MWKDFKDFLARGNIIELAVAFVIGTAFAAVIQSLVKDIIMPLIGIVIGGIDFTSLAITVGSANVTYGNFIQALVLFLIIAFVMFIIVRAYQNMKARMGKEPPAAPPPPTPDIVLLTEIRDLLKNRTTVP